MTEKQGWCLVAAAWWAIAVIDTPHDGGTLFYQVLAIWAAIKGLRTKHD